MADCDFGLAIVMLVEVVVNGDEIHLESVTSDEAVTAAAAVICDRYIRCRGSRDRVRDTHVPSDRHHASCCEGNGTWTGTGTGTGTTGTGIADHNHLDHALDLYPALELALCRDQSNVDHSSYHHRSMQGPVHLYLYPYLAPYYSQHREQDQLHQAPCDAL